MANDLYSKYSQTQSQAPDRPSIDQNDLIQKLKQETTLAPTIQDTSPIRYTLDDLRDFGEANGICPYFLARRFLLKANVIVYNYSYMLDPKISNIVSAELQKDCIVIFDECHNIDNVCIESFSLNINNRVLDSANNCIKNLDQLIQDQNKLNTDKFRDEIIRLTQNLP